MLKPPTQLLPWSPLSSGGEATGLKTFWFCLQPVWAQEATGGKLASLEPAVSPRPPELVAAGLLVEW